MSSTQRSQSIARYAKENIWCCLVLTALASSTSAMRDQPEICRKWLRASILWKAMCSCVQEGEPSCNTDFAKKFLFSKHSTAGEEGQWMLLTRLQLLWAKAVQRVLFRVARKVSLNRRREKFSLLLHRTKAWNSQGLC